MDGPLIWIMCFWLADSVVGFLVLHAFAATETVENSICFQVIDRIKRRGFLSFFKKKKLSGVFRRKLLLKFYVYIYTYPRDRTG